MAKSLRKSAPGESANSTGNGDESAPRTIVLLSDGTGNGSASVNKSNIWRIFQAIDTGPRIGGQRRQLVFYDDGVGTSGFRPWQYLSQAFGFGLYRNVRQLYLELCRHYRPGDRIYLFGFSRGAFTIRVLAHMIAKCGILDRARPVPSGGGPNMESDHGIRRGARHAYCAYRYLYWRDANGWLKLVGLCWRFIRNLWATSYSPEDFSKSFSYPIAPAGEGHPLIEFIGVFDTVDAHGLPVDELSDALNFWIYPYKFQDFTLNGHVGRARQALAIDDSRHTFWPLLWDETGEAPDRIRQVWFAGMHADIGGGYPDDNLSYAPLLWMTEQAEQSGLRFASAEIEKYREAARATARMHNSRRGVAVYYRYRPREISALTSRPHGRAHTTIMSKIGEHAGRVGDLVLAQRNLGVQVDAPIIHHSVIERIQDQPAGYAPTAIDKSFEIWRPGGEITGPTTEENCAVALIDRAAAHIFWRRVCYFGMLAPSLMLAWISFRFWYWELPFAAKPKLAQAPLQWLLQTAADWFTGFPMGIIGHTLKSWATDIEVFFPVALVGAFFYFWGNIYIAPIMRKFAEAGWATVKYGKALPKMPDPGFFEALATRYLGSESVRPAMKDIWQIVLTIAFLAGGPLVVWFLAIKLAAMAQ